MPQYLIAIRQAFLGLAPWELFEKLLLTAVVLDLSLGGNGYLIKIAGLRIREVLFVVCLGWAVARLTVVKPIEIDRAIWAMAVLFVASTALGIVIGYLGSSSTSAMLAELKPLGYFPMILFFAVAIQNHNDVSMVAVLLAASAIVLSALYLGVLLCTWLGIIEYSAIYSLLRVSDEFIFRHNPSYGVFIGFFYKGMFYACVGAIFLILAPLRIAKAFAVLCLVAVAMTLTRGLVFSLLVCLLVALALNGNWRLAPLLIGLSAVLLAVLFAAQRAETRILIASGDLDETQGTMWTPGAYGVPKMPTLRSERLKDIGRPTDSIRAEDIKFVWNSLDLRTALVGKGIGAPIRHRDRIETTYLELLYKQGILGLAVWALLAFFTLRYYRWLPIGSKQMGVALLLSSLFVYLSTASNTFLTGSIGMAVVFIALTGMRALGNDLPRPSQINS